MRALGLLAVLAASAAAAQGARLAVHPLALRELSQAQREIVQAQFDVMLARIGDIRLAGSSAVEEALLKPAGKGCETRDECLRFFAEATESVYGVYARLRPDPLGAQLLARARVVRSDGVVVRNVSLAIPIEGDVELTETARQLLGELLDALALDTLSATVTLEPVAQPSPSPQPGVQSEAVGGSPRQPVGFALLGIGAATLAAGGVFAGLAVSGRSKLTPDRNGAVPLAQANRALEVAREGQAATVLLPVGIVIAVVGGALAWWPAGAPVAVSVLAGPDRAGLQVGGRLP